MSKLYLSSPSIILVFILLILSGPFHTEYSSGKISNPDLVHSSDRVATVEMTNTMKFSPDTVRINPGDTVKWINNSLLAHTVTADPSEAAIQGSASLPEGAKKFNSGMMDPEETFTHSFEIEGTYQYFCIPHEGTKMIGWVIVEG